MTENKKDYTAQNIADYLGGVVDGDPDVVVNGICKIDQGKKGGLSFLSNPKYEKFIYTTEATAVLVSRDFDPKKKVSATLIRVEDPYLSLSRLMDFYDQSKAGAGIGKNTFIHESATLGENVYVGEFTYVSENASIGNNVQLFPQVYIGRNVVIKDNTILYPGSRIYQDTMIGSDCIIHSGAVIGSDGYGFARQPDKSYKKIPQLGNVILGDRVEIGANVTIDRAAMGSTIIHDGVKISNLVEIAHSVEVGENTLIIGMTGIAGSSKIGKNCILGGQVGIAGHISVADNVNIGARAGVSNNIKEEGAIVLGFPARSLTQEKRSMTVYGRLPELEKMVQELRKELDELKSKK